MNMSRNILVSLVVLSTIAGVSATFAQRPRPELLLKAEDPDLPRVLVLGDSISIGYLPHLRKLLSGKANVQHPPENCLSSRHTLERLEQYLGDKHWDVVLFNCGIHDLTFRDPSRKFLAPDAGGKIDVPLDEYRDNLEKIVARLQKTNATLIWCTTSPVGADVGHRRPDDVKRYNDAAIEIMKSHDITVADPYVPSEQRPEPKLAADGVHFTRSGYLEIAKQLRSPIESALKIEPKQSDR